MSRFSVAQYDALERAIIDRRRISVQRPKQQLVIVPLKIRTVKGREYLDARHPTTGDALTLALDELLGFEVV